MSNPEMTVTVIIPQNGIAPECLDMIFENGEDTNVDFSASVASAYFSGTNKATGLAVGWDASIFAVSTDNIRLKHFLDPSDTAILGRIGMRGYFNLSGGGRMRSIEFVVVIGPEF